ncbi:MAG: transposase [Kiritimatiellae bacterium]|nr:transposase [Kiritimatiellia bacterium]
MTDEQKSGVRQEVKHHMGRRCFDWDYSSRCIYMITITLADRSRPVLGQLAGEGEEWRVEPSEIGRIVEQCWREIPQQWPGVEIIENQLMPDHFHGIIFVKEQQKKKLGNIIGSFKSKSSSRTGELLRTRKRAESVRGKAQNGEEAGQIRTAGLWAPGYVDLILFRKGQLEKMIAYIRDNPQRLGIKRAHPELFKVARDIEVELGRTRPSAELSGGVIPPWHGPAKGHFMAIGNHFLLTWPVICQIQCSRSFFAYKRERVQGGWRICHDAAGKPIVEMTTPEFEMKAGDAMRASAQGAVLLSPCISHGEREIARRAFEAGYRVITLQNKGFSPLYKPGGRLFETCAAGNLLMLAPCNIAARGEAQNPARGDAQNPARGGTQASRRVDTMTREQALVLNRIAQLIADDGAVEIDYKGVVLSGIDEAVALAISSPHAAERETPHAGERRAGEEEEMQ